MLALPSLAQLIMLASPVIDHDVDVTINVPERRIDVVDRLTLDVERTVVGIMLHAGMQPAVDGATVALTSVRSEGGVPAELVHATFPRPTRELTLRYGGVIDHPPTQVGTEHQRSFQETPGTIADEGVYLSAAALWLARLVDSETCLSNVRRGVAPEMTTRCMPYNELVTTTVRVRGLPEHWRALSEGNSEPVSGGVQSAWRAATPSDDAHLVAGPFFETKERVRGVDVLIWLRAIDGVLPPDGKALAQRYIEVTGQYLGMYSEMIGPYPYGKFALVENYWDTGWGLASFTLLGPQVIRFPFILHTSWPHELLHNWWGNGVYVKKNRVEDGNWSEGLTAYLADHLHAEHEGKSDEYRRTTLQKYQDFVASDPSLDFPLAAFGSRSSAASEAVGYGKWLMVVHMLRKKLGDDAFKSALRKLWQEHRFGRASFDDVRGAFQTQTMEDLAPFFDAWVQRSGAPRIRWREVREVRDSSGARHVAVVLEQTQKDSAWPMDVPVTITTSDGRAIAAMVSFAHGAKSARVSIPVTASALRVDVDPFADVFRALLDGETAPALSRALGAKKAVFVLPTLAGAPERGAWHGFARSLCAACRTVDDNDLDTLPDDAAVWVLGYGNQLRGGVAAVSSVYGARFDDHGFLSPGKYSRERLKSERTDPRKTSVVLALPHPRDGSLAMTFVGAHSSAAIAPLARKIPHYAKYGYLAFSGDVADNVLKGQWQPVASPLTVFLGSAQPILAHSADPALAKLPPPFDADRMVEDVRTLAKLNGRALGTKDLDKALDLVQVRFAATFSDVVRRCTAAAKHAASVCNIVATLPGRDRALPAVVLGAHVDHLGRVKGKVHPGADDNASGVAVLLEVARALAQQGGFSRDVVFVAFSGEEEGLLGSRGYVQTLASVGAPVSSRVHSMLNLDSVGRGDAAKPLLVLDGHTATEWVHIVRGVAFTTGVRAELAKEGGGASDQTAFLEAGIPAVQLFSGAHADWHRSTDTADKIDSASLVNAAVIAREMTAYLADRKEPLTMTGGAGRALSATRRVSLGTIPDMTFTGLGVRIDDVVAGSPAAAAPLQKGDVLMRFDGAAVTDLRGYSELLKAKKPGDSVVIIVARAGKEIAFDVTLGER
jgi:hypothetical protein